MHPDRKCLYRVPSLLTKKTEGLVQCVVYEQDISVSFTSTHIVIYVHNILLLQ